MDKVYHWVGFFFVWVFIGVTVGIAGYLLWRALPVALTRKLGNAWVWVRVFVFGIKWRLPYEGSRVLLTMYSGNRTLARWERDVIAAVIRHSKPFWRMEEVSRETEAWLDEEIAKLKTETAELRRQQS
ncbi:hypothetical protein [Hymenobacter koreensis]|uniref:Uncharacterized protein n=1 Tax=Hymenobacter koreensis TaxID=1084523 RepID=A0ABP8JNM8_9BACT